jgi:GNAT superfamily N-acetyltransferase
MAHCRDLRVRPALTEDRGFLFEVRRATLRAYVEQTSLWVDAEQRAAAAKEFAELPYAVVEEGERSVGYVCVIHGKECDFLEEIALLPDVQGRGIGTQLCGTSFRRPIGVAYRSGSVSSPTTRHGPSMHASGSQSCRLRIRE